MRPRVICPESEPVTRGNLMQDSTYKRAKKKTHKYVKHGHYSEFLTPKYLQIYSNSITLAVIRVASFASQAKSSFFSAARTCPHALLRPPLPVGPSNGIHYNYPDRRPARLARKNTYSTRALPPRHLQGLPRTTRGPETALPLLT